MIKNERCSVSTLEFNIKDFKEDFENRLSLIDAKEVAFKRSQASILQIKNQIKNLELQHFDFTSDPVFKNSQDNYTKLYLELSNQRKILDENIKPVVEKLRIKVNTFHQTEDLEK